MHILWGNSIIIQELIVNKNWFMDGISHLVTHLTNNLQSTYIRNDHCCSLALCFSVDWYSTVNECVWHWWRVDPITFLLCCPSGSQISAEKMYTRRKKKTYNFNVIQKVLFYISQPFCLFFARSSTSLFLMRTIYHLLQYWDRLCLCEYWHLAQHILKIISLPYFLYVSLYYSYSQSTYFSSPTVHL